MKIYVQVKPKSKKEFVRKVDSNHYIIAVKEPPVQGKANKAIISALAEYFNKPKSEIYIISGETAKQKIIEVPVTQKTLF